MRDFKPSLWSEFFAEKDDIVVDDKRTFRIYRTKQPEKPGPVLLLLHGGGYSGLTWAHFCVSVFWKWFFNYLFDRFVFGLYFRWKLLI